MDERPKPRSCSLRSFTQVHHEKRCTSPLLTFTSSSQLRQLSGNSGVDVCADRNLSVLEYAGDVSPMTEHSNKFQTILDRLNNGIIMSGMCFEPSKCQMLMWKWISSKSNLVLYASSTYYLSVGLHYLFVFSCLRR